ncbi:MAG: imidazoleglycerol-phosphate dehydratase HisB [Chitinivibrionales bacterium]|nr:imidazoleglycerol-phosphate dehydratase HisB [Chitinivibrionales bacterium]MBD3394169.1 imidazoleglycerol-phosphate dehydratase HisB [Chitinivibrionales bacterium]
MTRRGEIKRTTKETDITVTLAVDGSGQGSINSGNGFFDHMLTLFARHGLFDLDVACRGDREVDFHHSAEDIGICMGQAFAQALGDHTGLTRFGTAYVPMDESLARVCIDLSGRANLVYSVSLADRTISTFECDLAEDFFKAFVDNARATVHVDLLRGRNSHHSLEAVFKAFGRALSQACGINPRASNAIPSTKGTL